MRFSIKQTTLMNPSLSFSCSVYPSYLMKLLSYDSVMFSFTSVLSGGQL